MLGRRRICCCAIIRDCLSLVWNRCTCAMNRRPIGIGLCISRDHLGGLSDHLSFHPLHFCSQLLNREIILALRGLLLGHTFLIYPLESVLSSRASLYMSLAYIATFLAQLVSFSVQISRSFPHRDQRGAMHGEQRVVAMRLVINFLEDIIQCFDQCISGPPRGL